MSEKSDMSERGFLSGDCIHTDRSSHHLESLNGIPAWMWWVVLVYWAAIVGAIFVAIWWIW